MAEWIKQNKTHIYAAYKRLTRSKNTDWKWEDRKLFHTNGTQKKARVAILRQNRLENKGCNKRQRKTLHNVQGSTQEEDIKTKHTHNQPQYIRQRIDIKGEPDGNTIIVEDLT